MLQLAFPFIVSALMFLLGGASSFFAEKKLRSEGLNEHNVVRFGQYSDGTTALVSVPPLVWGFAELLEVQEVGLLLITMIGLVIAFVTQGVLVTLGTRHYRKLQFHGIGLVNAVILAVTVGLAIFAAVQPAPSAGLG